MKTTPTFWCAPLSGSFKGPKWFVDNLFPSSIFSAQWFQPEFKKIIYSKYLESYDKHGTKKGSVLTALKRPPVSCPMEWH